MPGGFPISQELCSGNSRGTNNGGSVGTSLTCGNNAYGSFAEITASTPFDTCWAIVALQTNGSVNNAEQLSINIAVGASGSENVIAHDLMVLSRYLSYYTSTYAFPIQIPAGTRIAAQGYTSGATDTAYVSLLLFDGSFTQMEGSAGVDSIGWSGGQGINVTTGTSETKSSSYSQLTASTSRDYIGIMFTLDVLNGSSNLANLNVDEAILLDIAIGSANNEVAIVPNYPISVPNAPVEGRMIAFLGSPSPFIACPIPAGTRISARAQDIAGSKSFGLTVYGVYQ